MFFVGRHVSRVLRGTSFWWLALLMAVSMTPAKGQTAAPYVIPYTMSTFAGPVAGLTIGQKCGNYVSLDTVGDGCPAQYVSVGADPHDIRVDAKGNIYWFDDGSPKEVIHKISPVTGVETIYAGSEVQTKVCTTAADKYGDGCVATDGAANSGTTTYYTGSLPKSRGLGVAANGDLYLADYGGNEDHKLTAATGVFSLIAGTGTAAHANGPIGTSAVNGSRGIGVDSNTGTVYIADTANNVIRMVTPAGVTSDYTNEVPSSIGGGSAGCTKSLANGIPVGSAIVCAPEDVQVDPNGNVYIADAGNSVIEAIWNGKGHIPGVASPCMGCLYVVAGYNALIGGTNNVYPKSSASTTFPPAYPATSITISVRKISVDQYGNIFIADAGSNVIWFVDNATGYIRLIAGNYGGTAGVADGLGCTASVDGGFGDGCPGPLAGLYTSAGSDASNAADNEGNLYIGDSEGASSASTARLRKLLSGLNFGTVYTASLTNSGVAVGSSLTQTIFVHFAPGDKQAAANAFVSSNPDFVVGTANCETTANTDTTSDCLVPVTFTPTAAGYETSTLTVTSLLGQTTSYQLTGTGNDAQISIDPGSVAQLTTPTTNNAQGVALDEAGNAYIADTGNNRVLKYTATTKATTVFAGTGIANYTGDGGQALLATLKGPKAVAVDTTGNVYIADTGNNVIRKVTASGVISTYAGAGTVCSQAVDALGDGCFGTQATFASPSGLAADNLGQLYISDTGNNLIRQINVLGNVSVLAGGATTVCTAATDTFGDGCSGAQSKLNGPTGLAFDATGNFLDVADTGDNVVRKIFLANSFSTTGTGSSTLATNIQFNGIALVAGNGQTGGSSNGVATASSLTAPTGVSVDAAENVYIADTGDSVIQMVNATSGTITPIVGILTTPGTGTVPGSANGVELTTPAAVGVMPSGTLLIADSGNNRILTDVRSQVAYNFGTIGITLSSSTVVFTETNTGSTATTMSTPLYVATGGNAGIFSLTAPSGSSGCVAGEAFAVGASCILDATFTPAAVGTFSETYTESTPSAAGNPSITLTGSGAVLTTTSSTVVQSSPSSGNAQFGASLTLTASVKPSTCSTIPGATCFPSGTIKISVDGTLGGPLPIPPGGSSVSQTYMGLTVGQHTISCVYSGDSYYSSSTCPNVVITIAQASTTSLLSASPNNQPQYPTTNCTANTPATGDTYCVATTLNATVISNTTGSPTGTVTFYANGKAVGTGNISPTTGVATLMLTYIRDANYNLISDTTLPPGTYQLTCTYNGAANYATSNCAATTFTIVGQTPSFTLVARGCAAINLLQQGTAISGEGVGCQTGTEIITNGVPTVGTAQGSTTDATIFINATNTVSGTLTFSCAGLPQYSTCTFSPTSIALSPSTNFAFPSYVDVTLWTDIQPAQATASLHAPSIGSGRDGVTVAAIVGWPMTLLGLVGIVCIRRKRSALRGLALMALMLVMMGCSLIFSGCAGPGAYVPVLTPAGTYPVTVTVSGAGITQSVVVNFKVSAPGIVNQE